MPHAGVRRHRAARPTGGILDAMRPQSPSPTRDAVPAPQENVWLAAVRSDPEHPRRYAQRWDRFEEMGRDIDGEARLVDSLAERGARILDAGCGTGRVGGRLAALGHAVAGVDLDPHLISVARERFPGQRWEVGNLAEFTLAGEDGSPDVFDLIVCAGNVPTFLAEAERRPALERMLAHLAPGGRLVTGFGAGRGYPFEDFTADAQATGWRVDARFSTWQLHPPAEDFLVALLSRADG